jgi:hypothetical protein
LIKSLVQEISGKVKNECRPDRREYRAIRAVERLLLEVNHHDAAKTFRNAFQPGYGNGRLKRGHSDSPASVQQSLLPSGFFCVEPCN